MIVCFLQFEEKIKIQKIRFSGRLIPTIEIPCLIPFLATRFELTKFKFVFEINFLATKLESVHCVTRFEITLMDT